MSKEMINVQRSFHEIARALNKLLLAESRFLDTKSSGCRYIAQWNNFRPVRIYDTGCLLAFDWSNLNRSTVRCIYCHWTLYPKINIQPIRTCLTHAQIRGMTVGHVSFRWTYIALHSVNKFIPRRFKVIPEILKDKQVMFLCTWSPFHEAVYDRTNS